MRDDSIPLDDPEPSTVVGATTLDFSRYRARRIRRRLRALLDDLVAAVERRDVQAVWDVLDERDAGASFPPAVREEALQIVRMPRVALRAPVTLYRFYHVLSQLEDEPVMECQDPLQLVLDWSHAQRDEQERCVLPFADRHAAGRTDDGPRDGPGRRRRSSAR